MAYKLKGGQRFGRLTVIERFGTNNHKEATWLCLCDCGKTTVVSASYLVHGHTKSCGCLVSERTVEANRTHGETGTKLYRAYTNMMTRCYNPNYKYFHAYGGRGISVCDEWRGNGGYERFSTWAKQNGYDPMLTLDRADVNGNYTPQNCRWATMKQQQNNRTNNATYEYNGEVKTMAEWAETLGVSYGRLQAMLWKKKLPMSEAVKRIVG